MSDKHRCLKLYLFLNHQNKRQNHCEEGLTLEEPANGEKRQHD